MDESPIDLSMGRTLLVILSFISVQTWAQENASLILAGTVPERIEFEVVQQNGQWAIQQTSNGHLQAILIQDQKLGRIVSVRAP